MKLKRKQKNGKYDVRAQRLYEKGDAKFWCPVCAINVLRSETRMRWDGLRTCLDCWEPKHPQLEVPTSPKNEAAPVRYVSAELTDTFSPNNDNATRESNL